MTIMYVEGVITPDGTPWEPVPGPDPWDDLVVVDKEPGLRTMSTLLVRLSLVQALPLLVVLVMRPIVLVSSLSPQQIVIGLTQNGLII